MSTMTQQRHRWKPDWLQPEIAAILVVAAVLAVSAAEILFWGKDKPTSTEMDALGVIVLAGSALILFWRRRYALVVLVGVGLLALTFIALDYPPEATIPAVVVALYSVGAEGDRGTTLLIAAIVALTIGLTYVSEQGLGIHAGSGMLLDIFRLLFPLALGDAVRSRRAYEKQLLQRAEEAERTREEEAISRVQEERIRIARDIHDVVSHSISTINVQAGVAAHLVEKDPDQAGAALETIKNSTKDALTELRSMLGVLRNPEDGAPLAPTPTADEAFETLFTSIRNAGMLLDVSVHGEQPSEPLTEATRIATYRIVQESLTNALRHGGDSTVALSITWGRDAATVQISNPVAANEVSEGAGAGILGMKERATTLGGSFDAGLEEDGRWVVRAELPYRNRP